MFDLIRIRQRAFLQILLAIVVMQSVFVAFEFGEEFGHSSESVDIHHSSIFSEQDLAISPDNSIWSEIPSKSDLTQTDSCDHCCHCHGHGSHAAIITDIAIPLIQISDSEPFPSNQLLTFDSFKSIYRPPIA